MNPKPSTYDMDQIHRRYIFYLDFWRRKFEKFMADFNGFNPNIQFTYESSKKSITFLDLDVALYNGRLESTVHVKPTDRHQYLHHSFSHPEHAKRSTVFSQTFSAIRFVPVKRTFEIIASK